MTRVLGGDRASARFCSVVQAFATVALAGALALAIALVPSRVAADGSLLPAALPSSAGPTYYVSESGSDSAAGSLEAPFRSLGRALSVVGAGGKVVVRGGTYGEWVTLSRGGSAAAPVTLTAFPGERVTLTGRLKVSASFVRVTGLRFVGGTAANPSDVLVYVSGGDDVEVSGNELTGAAMSAVYVGDPGDGADRFRFLGNWVHDNGSHFNLDHGLYCGTSRGALIANNVFERSFAYGVHLYPDCDGAVVTGNTVVGSGRSGIIVGGESSTSDGNVVVNNVVAFNKDYGVRVYWGGPVGSGNVVRGNLFFGNGAGDMAGGSLAAGLSLVDNAVADPLFVDRQGGDYHLRPGSPAAAAGVAGYELPTDFDGHPRGTPSSLGAFELAGPAPAPQVPAPEVPAPDFTLAASPAAPTVTQGEAVDVALTVEATGGFDAPVAFRADGLPRGATASVDPGPAGPSASMSISAAADTPVGSYRVTITATAAGLTHTTTVSLKVVAPSDFALDVSPASMSVSRGQSGSVEVSVKPAGGFDGAVSLQASGVPAGTSAQFSPDSGGAARTLILATTSRTPAGTFKIVVTGTSGSLTRSASVELTVVAPAPSVSVSPDVVLPQETAIVEWSNVSSPRRWNWLGVYEASTDRLVSWVYTNSCTTRARWTVRSAGSCPMAMPPIPGQYDIRLHANDTTVLAVSSPVTVQATG